MTHGRPLMLSSGRNPQYRLSALLSRLSPMTKQWPGGNDDGAEIVPDGVVVMIEIVLGEDLGVVVDLVGLVHRLVVDEDLLVLDLDLLALEADRPA